MTIPVQVIGKKRGIVDLMLSRATRRHRADDIEHLVVELKAPKVKISADEITQAKRYAMAVSQDERFHTVKGVRWHFWIVSNSYDDFAKGDIEGGPDPVRQLIHRKNNISVGIKTREGSSDRLGKSATRRFIRWSNAATARKPGHKPAARTNSPSEQQYRADAPAESRIGTRKTRANGQIRRRGWTARSSIIGVPQFRANPNPNVGKEETTMKIVTSLSFKGQCREAFEFYAKVLGGKITAAMPYGDAPPGMPITDEKYKTWLMHCWLEVGDQALMGADMDVEWARNIDKPKNGFDVTLHTEDKAEAQRWFDQLSEGGTPVMQFGETFWSPGFGSLIDRFGVPWMVNVVPSAGWKPPQG